jgi:hypothetical protein
MNIGRWEHHQLASLIASRDISDAEASVLTCYSPKTISNLRYQRAFQELVQHYHETQERPAPPDTAARMQNVGLTSLEELQGRLTENPELFSNRDLLEISELLLVKAKTLQAPGPSQAPVKLAISFVTASHPREDPKLVDAVPLAPLPLFPEDGDA